MTPQPGLRIIAGELKGRRLRVPRAGVRPTGEKAREALFDILGTRMAGARVLDLYSGSGALGFEALSRGARSVLFVEADPEALRVLQLNVLSLGVASRCRVRRARVLDALSVERFDWSFDLILADPPYAGDEASRLRPLIEASALLAPDGLLVVERASRRTGATSDSLERVRTARYGDTCLDFWARPSPG